MSHLVYCHTAPPSIRSRLIQVFLRLYGMKRRMENKIKSDGYRKTPAQIPGSILKNNNLEVAEISGRKVWTLSPKNNEANIVILFLHGGAYYANITFLHWRFIKHLLNKARAKIIVPDYPLAPQQNCKDTYRFIDKVYEKLINQYPSKNIVFMGDSAGGGLALGYAQKIKNENLRQPQNIILLSPWLDVSMANNQIAQFDKLDTILNVKGLKLAGKSYADDLDILDFRVSPINGNCSNLAPISIFIGTNELLIADARRFRQLLESQHVGVNYFEYPGMFHDWAIVTFLKEAKDVIDKIVNSLKTVDE